MDALIVVALFAIVVILAFTSPQKQEVALVSTVNPLFHAAQRFAMQGFISENCI